MSLSPFDSFQSRFVTYLLNRPRTSKTIISIETAHSNMALVCVVSTSGPKCQNLLPVLSSGPHSDISTKEITSSGLLKTVCPVPKILY